MSQNVTPEMKLTALALAAPIKRPYRDCDDLRPYCALSRAATALGRPTYSIYEFGKALGFTRFEVLGIMRGWDLAEGHQPLFDDALERDPQAVTRGEAVGRRVHAALRATQVRVGATREAVVA